MVVTDYNEQFLDKRGTDHLIDELKAYIDSIPNGNVDLSDYVTKSELQAKLDALDINIDLSSYATKEELTQAINSIDLSAYAKKTDIPSLNGYALKTEIPNKVSELENDSGYLSSIPEEYVTETELNAKGYLTSHQDLSAYALKTEIPSLDGYATTQYVDNAIANVPSGGNVDLSNYYTKEETNALIPSTDGLATTEYVDNAVSNIPTTDLSNYYTKAETYSKTEVDTLVANSGGSGGGGASGITYAYDTEIATGETWVDGKPIYLKVFHIDALKSQSKTIDYKEYYSQPKFAETIVSVVPTWKNSSNTSTGFMDDVVSSVSTSSRDVGSNVNSYILSKMMWCTVYNGDNFSLVIGRGNSRYTASCDVFVKYTKL